MQVLSTFKGKKKKASGKLTPFYFNIMFISMPTSLHALVLENFNFLSLEELNLSMNLFFLVIVMIKGEGDLNPRCFHWKHHEISIKLQNSWPIILVAQ